jgi:hypothetical protein
MRRIKGYAIAPRICVYRNISAAWIGSMSSVGARDPGRQRYIMVGINYIFTLNAFSVTQGLNALRDIAIEDAFIKDRAVRETRGTLSARLICSIDQAAVAWI